MDKHVLPHPLPLDASLAWEQMISQENPCGISSMASYCLHPTSNQQSFYFKTQMCLRFKTGRCPNGRSCNFAHSFEELRRPLSGAYKAWLPPHEGCNARNRQRPSIPNGYGRPYQNGEQMLKKNKACKKFCTEGICSHGDGCSLLHGNSVSSSQRVLQWKSKLCHKWLTSGQCPNGDQCYYAHGNTDVRKAGSDHCKVRSTLAGKVLPKKEKFEAHYRSASDFPKIDNPYLR